MNFLTIFLSTKSMDRTFAFLFFRWNVLGLRLSTYLTPSITIYEIIYLFESISNFACNLNHFEGVSQNYQRPGPFLTFLSI